jgi:hypothetical protein
MFFQRTAGSAISSRLLHASGFFGSRNAVSPETSRLFGLLQRRQPTMQTFDFKNYSDLRYFTYITRSKKNTIYGTQLRSTCCDRANETLIGLSLSRMYIQEPGMDVQPSRSCGGEG